VSFVSPKTKLQTKQNQEREMEERTPVKQNFAGQFFIDFWCCFANVFTHGLLLTYIISMTSSRDLFFLSCLKMSVNFKTWF
jgi:hypothetical protein